MPMTVQERNGHYSGAVQLVATTGGPDEQGTCPQGYQVTVKRGDGKPLSEMELRTVLNELAWAIDGDESLIDLERT